MRCQIPLRVHGMVDLLEFAVGIVGLSVVRTIDQLSDGEVDLLVLVSTGRTVQCKLLTDVAETGRSSL